MPDTSRHRLGNLVLLPPKLNSALQDKPAKGKAAHYRKTGLLITGEVADVIDPADWNSRSIKERGERLLKWAAGHRWQGSMPQGEKRESTACEAALHNW